MSNFIEQIAKYVMKYAPLYGIAVHSPIIAQAILESASGTSELAKNAHNYFGLKYRQGRCKTCIGIYNKVGSEQAKDGSYTSSAMKWCKFINMENGVIGYFDFINIANYSNLKGVTDPETYLCNIKADGYATSLNYVDNLMAVIKKYGLTNYDKKEETKMSNSSLVDCKVMSPNHSGTRTHKIDRITPHCVVGQLKAENIGGCFTSKSREASCNYGIGTDGRVCLIVDEANRSWCSSSSANDQRAITIECASDKTEPYAMNTAVYNKLIQLCVDICKRNGKNTLLWIDNKDKALSYEPKDNEMLLTVHRWFANKSCPGNWLYSRLGNVAKEVTALLNGGKVEEESETKKPLYRVQIGAYSKKTNADAQLKKVKSKGFADAFITQVGNLYKVQVGAYSVKANADNMLKRVKAAGFDAFITTQSGSTVSTQPISKSVDEIAKEVISGKWGNGADRKKRLEAAGYNYAQVQAVVNRLL